MTSLPSPPYMLGERPTSHHKVNIPSFQQVPFISVYERVESGIKIRKQLRKYMQVSSQTQHLVSQMHLNDACITSIPSQEIAHSSFETFFQTMREYNQIVGQKHVEAAKAFTDLSKPLDQPSKSKRWARDIYNTVQKAVQEVTYAEKKLEKSKSRLQKAKKDVLHWHKVLDANEATYQVQANNQDVLRAYQSAQHRSSSANVEEIAAYKEYTETQQYLQYAIKKRDTIVSEATDLFQSMEEDRLDTMLIVIKQFVEAKATILQSEIDAISTLRKRLKKMDSKIVIQQYIKDTMRPELTHKQHKALCLLKWHETTYAQAQVRKKDLLNTMPKDLLSVKERKSDEIAKLKMMNLTQNDLEQIKCYILRCFITPATSIVVSIEVAISQTYLEKQSLLERLRLPIMRELVTACLNHQRSISTELSEKGYTSLVSVLRLTLDAAAEVDDKSCMKRIMNMSQTFYRKAKKSKHSSGDKVYLFAALSTHTVWDSPEYWADALLLSIGEALSNQQMSTDETSLADVLSDSPKRTQKVIETHTIIYGQVASYISNLVSFRYSKKQIKQYIKHVCQAYDLSEDLRLNLFESIQSMGLESKGEPRLNSATDEEIIFKLSCFPEWSRNNYSTTASASSNNDQQSNGHNRNRAGTFETMWSDSDDGANMSQAASHDVRTEAEWEDLFGGGDGLDDTNGGRKEKKSWNSRKFNNQLRSARGVSISDRLQIGIGHNGHDASRQHEEAVETNSHNVKETKKKNRKKSQSSSNISISTSEDSIDIFAGDDEEKAPAVLTPATTPITRSSRSASASFSSTDQIRSIAASMKSRRKEKSASQQDIGIYTSTIKDSKKIESKSDEDSNLSGVTAMRAKFERKKG